VQDWEGNPAMVPRVETRRFGVDRRPLNPALREIGAKAILVESSDQPTLPFDVVESKLHGPSERIGIVPRTALVNRLRAAGTFPVVLVIAPAGYGKTMLLSQWAARDARPFAWVSVDERDDDPFVLLKHVAAAVDQVEPIGVHVAEALARPDDSIWEAIVPRLSAELSSRTSPFVIVLDGADAIASTDSVEAIGVLIENIPPGSMIALAGRALPTLPVAALRVAGPLLEIGPYELALSRREAEILLRASGVELAENEITGLLQRTEGWAAGLQLAALASQQEGDERAEPLDFGNLTGDERHIADYLRSEYLSRIAPRVLRFLRRTSVLERMCAPLCNAVLKSKSSALELEAIGRANLFFVQLDHRRGWCRYHHFFRDLLQRELEEHEPDLVPVLHRRAAAWYEAHGDPESALFHAHAAGDIDDAARILSSIALQVHDSGRVAVVEGWLDLFDVDERLDRHPAVAIQGSRIHAVRGRAEEADRWLHAAERGVASRRKGVAAVRPWIAVMHAAMCTEGPAKMQADAHLAVAKLGKDDPWRPAALLVQGAAALLLGDTDRADPILAEAVERSARIGSTETHAVAVGERSLIATARDDIRTADALAEEARLLVEDGELGSYPTSVLALAASARSRLRHGQWGQARDRLTAAARLTPHLTYALPWLAVQARIELADAYVTLRDHEAAQHMLEGARGILTARPALGVLGDGVERLEQEIAAMPGTQNGVSSGLTRAELRLLPVLSTHLSFREIGERLHVSRNTIKTQAISVYRKLGVSSRSEAVALAQDLGLVETAEPKDGRFELDESIPSVAS
jgi:LuxR family transcriptional regulator, maltose regulon positive regulatory protein